MSVAHPAARLSIPLALNNRRRSLSDVIGSVVILPVVARVWQRLANA